MGTPKLLILENQLGQKVRTISVDTEKVYVVYIHDRRRVETYSSLEELDLENVKYTLLTSLNLTELNSEGVNLLGIGTIRWASHNDENSPIYALPEVKEDEELKPFIFKSTFGHLTVVGLLMLSSWVWLNYIKKEETPLVTIVLPKDEAVKKEIRPHVKVSEKKIVPTNKIVQQKVLNPLKTKPIPTPKSNSRDIGRMGALAALGGLSNGKQGYEGLDSRSMKAIRSAGTGSGGGGVGSAGQGGIKGYMPGSGLIAGSAGEGARAQSAGGYGTKGVGGGKAGYGKINQVGGISSVSLPSNDEVSVEGGLDRDQIIAVINRHQGEIVYCYEKGLQTSPNIGGRVAVDFVIGPNGRVSSARVAQTSLRSANVESCMLEKLRSWQFPRPVGNVNVDVLYPFELTRVSSR